MDQPSVDAAQVLEPIALTATGLHGRILFRAGDDAGSVMVCLGHQVLITPSSIAPSHPPRWRQASMTGEKFAAPATRQRCRRCDGGGSATIGVEG